MDISAALLEQIVAHARQEAPNECCGVVAVQFDGTAAVQVDGTAAVQVDGTAAVQVDGTAAVQVDGTAGVQADGTAGAPARATHVHRAVNTAASPLRFEIDGREVLGLIEAIEGGGLELGAIYHSHTRTAPYPSQTDINFAAHWPGVEWVIVGLAEGESPEVRSYLIDDGEVREVALEVR